MRTSATAITRNAAANRSSRSGVARFRHAIPRPVSSTVATSSNSPPPIGPPRHTPSAASTSSTPAWTATGTAASRAVIPVGSGSSLRHGVGVWVGDCEAG